MPATQMKSRIYVFRRLVKKNIMTVCLSHHGAIA